MKKRIQISIIALALAFTMLFAACGSKEADLSEDHLTENANTGSEEINASSDASLADSEEKAKEQAEDAEPTEEELLEAKIDAWIAEHSLEEKVAQLFMIRPETILVDSPLNTADSVNEEEAKPQTDEKSEDTVGVNAANQEIAVTQFGEVSEEFLKQYPVGGIIYFAKNLEGYLQTLHLLADTQNYASKIGMPELFLAVDEEGGTVARIAKNRNFGVENIGNAMDLASANDPELVYERYHYVGNYLREFGFNMDMAPVADIFTNPDNTVIGSRAFGSDADTVSLMVPQAMKGLSDAGILPVVKHFPGHGDTAEDSHSGFAYTYKTAEELRECELIPFEKAIEEGAEVIMVAHISTPGISGDDTPASLNPQIVDGLLREELGFDGIVITDGMNMGAIANHYSSAEASIMAIEAGCDIILTPADFKASYEGILAAVSEGRISEERVDCSIRRILRVKFSNEDEPTTQAEENTGDLS